MRPRHRSILPALLLLFATATATRAAERQTIWEWDEIARVVAIGDLHGGYDKLVQLLQGADLVDDSLHWTGGQTHLVVAGDFLDRGAAERVLMDLLRQLEAESEAVGGRLHVLLGNHEVMSLLRNTRYVNSTSYADFTAEERKEDRKAAWKAFAGAHLGNHSPGTTRTSFLQQYPDGFFGRQRMLDRDGEYGSWLLRLPAIVKLNGVVYVHGGLTEQFASLGIDGINRRVREVLDRHLRQRELLQVAKVVTLEMNYFQLRQAAQKALGRKRMSAELRQAAKAFLESVDSPILATQGPLWYRGNSFEDERIERDMLERSLELVGATTMVVAHSYTGGNRITSRFHGQLFRLDHGILESKKPLALVLERDEVLVLDAATKQTSSPVQELPYGVARSPRPRALSEAELEKFLTRAEITVSRDLGRGSTRPRLVVLEKAAQTRRGIFKTVERTDASDGGIDRYQHEVAAYRLSRLLGLHIVPVTVIRDVDGQRGSLQWWVEKAVDQKAAQAYALRMYETEAAIGQLAVGKVLDSLMANYDRKPSDVLCGLTGKQIHLIDHSRAFSESTEIFSESEQGQPDKNAARETLKATPELVQALRALDRKSLTDGLGKLLSKRQIEALLERRDKILALL